MAYQPLNHRDNEVDGNFIRDTIIPGQWALQGRCRTFAVWKIQEGLS